jgi:cyanophycinase
VRSALIVASVWICGCDAGGRGAPLDGSAPDAASVDAAPPIPPPGLTRWIVGDPADATAASQAGLVLMGGGPDVDEAFAWQRDRIDGGDVVVLRASGADGYNAYLFDEIGGVDSVETLLVDRAALADDPYVRWALDHAEAIFLAGGDQAVYVDAWAGTGVTGALSAAWSRGAVLGGTSAGCAVLGEIVFTAEHDTVYSDEALADPYNPYMTLTRGFLAVPPLAGVVTDTHFRERDRMGRLLGFAARAVSDGWSATPLGVGVDEGTALVVDERGAGRVLGDGAVYVLAPARPPETCAPGAPLAWAGVARHALRAGDSIALPGGDTTVPPIALSAADGALDPADPY